MILLRLLLWGYLFNVIVVHKSSDILALGMNGKGSARGLACEDHLWEAPLNAENISTWILCIFANAEAFTWPFQRLENGLLAFSSHFWLVPPRATASIWWKIPAPIRKIHCEKLPQVKNKTTTLENKATRKTWKRPCARFRKTAVIDVTLTATMQWLRGQVIWWQMTLK